MQVQTVEPSGPSIYLATPGFSYLEGKNVRGTIYQYVVLHRRVYRDETSKLKIVFVDPADLGFDKAEFPEKNIETIVVGHVVPGGMVFLVI